MNEDYERLHAQAVSDPQRAGHGAESSWAELLNNWLPSAYTVVTRKYIIMEDDSDSFETDLVVLSPGYPAALAAREEILAGGVAAAFSVRLTADASGIADAASRAERLRKGLGSRIGSPRRSLQGAFPVGFLAHSHNWKKDGSSPAANVLRALAESYDDSNHPREMLDYICIADLATWGLHRFVQVSKELTDAISEIGGPSVSGAQPAASILTRSDLASPAANPIASFVATLFKRLSYSDPSMRSTAEGFTFTDTISQAGGAEYIRYWNPLDLYDDSILVRLHDHGTLTGDPDWDYYFI